MITLKWFNKEGVSGGTFLVNIKDGVTYTDNYNEELDSATVLLINQNKLNFEPFDIVELTLPNIGTKTMLIDDFVENEMNLEEGIYQYTINLMSKTKELERVTLPSFSITKAKNLPAATLRQAINLVLRDYSPNYRGAGQIYTLSSPSGLNISCPDMQMTRPTMREALDRILSVKNSICYLDGDNKVNVMNLNKRNNLITLNEYYNYKPENQSSNDYATETENNYNNVVPNEISGIKNDTSVTEYKGFRSESMLVNDENAVLLTDNPIYDLLEVKWCGLVNPFLSKNGTHLYGTLKYSYNGRDYTQNVYDNHYFYFELDITGYILESQNFNILDYDTKKYRAYYTRGSNKIEGLLQYKKTILENYITLENIVYAALVNNPYYLLDSNYIVNLIKNNLPSSEQADFNKDNILNLQYSLGISDPIKIWNAANFSRYSMFKITYESQNENIRIKSSKYLPERNQNNVIIDNPGEAYVDIKRQGELFNQKANRLGNRIKYLQARFPSNYELPQLGDYWNDLVLIRREFSFYDDYILFKGTLSENYVNINYFTGINARKRSWNIIGPGEAFDKELLDKWYCSLSLSKKQSDLEDETMNSNLVTNLLNVINYGSWHPIISRAWLENDYTQWGDIGNKIELDLTSYISGNSLIFNFKVDDNYASGIAIQQPEATGGALEKYLQYTDGNGFAESYTIYLVKNYEVNLGVEIGDTYPENYNGDDDYGDLLEWSVRKPLLRNAWIPNMSSLIIYENTITNWKDSREKLGFNVQFEFVSDTPDIIIGEAFMERQMFMNTDVKQDTLFIRGHNSKYKVTDKSLKSDGTLLGTQANITVNGSGDQYVNGIMSISGLTNIPSDLESISISDSSGNLILAINTTDISSGINIYLSLIRNRDRRNYLNKNMKTWN